MKRLALSLLLALLAAPSWGQASRDFVHTNSDLLSCGDINSFDGNSNLTVAAWVNKDGNSGTDYVVSKRPAGSLNWGLYTSTAAPTFSVLVSAVLYTAQAANIGTGAWTCLVGTYDQSLGSARLVLYVNGAVGDTDDAANDVITASTAAVTIGARAGGAEFVDGKIAHVAIEARTWSAVEVADYCRGNLAVAQRAAGGTGGYLPLWDNAADPGNYIGQGLLSGACSSAADPDPSSDGPPVFIPGGN